MDLSTITVDDFKTQFRRGFPYLSIYSPAALYNTGDRVYYETTKLFYDCYINGTTGISPIVTANWAVVIDDTDNYVQDYDIAAAFAEALLVFNQSLFDTDANIRIGYLYLTAHYLVNDLRAAQAGLGATGAFPVNSRSVGSVSEAYQIPQQYTDDPFLSFYTSSSYGMKYLSMILPLLRGNFNAVEGRTLP